MIEEATGGLTPSVGLVDLAMAVVARHASSRPPIAVAVLLLLQRFFGRHHGHKKKHTVFSDTKGCQVVPRSVLRGFCLSWSLVRLVAVGGMEDGFN